MGGVAVVILHFLVTDRLSGSENVVIDILKHFKGGNEVYYVSPEGPIRECVEACGINYIACDTDDISQIKKVYREVNPDIVHACDPRMSFKCALAGIPFIAHLHNNCPWMKSFSPSSFALLYAIKRSEAVITVSDSIKEEYVFRRALGAKHFMISNAVDAKKVMRAAAEPFDKSFDIVFVGRLNEQKRPLLFLEFIKKLKCKIPSLTAVMVGEGELEGECRKYIAEERLDGVTLWGFDSNPYRIIQSSKINVFTSYYEGFGLVAVESMALCKPVLAFPAGGLAKIVNDGCGALCGSLDEMVTEAYNLLCDASLYEKKSKAAFERSKLFTDTEAYMEKISRVYSFVTEKRSGRGKKL